MNSILTGYRWSGAFVGAVLALGPRAAHACAMCGLPPGDHQAHAYNTSVLFMMAVPYSIVAGTIAGFYLAYRRGRRKRSERLRTALPSAGHGVVPESFE